MRRYPATADDVTSMPGRGTFSFLIVGNIAAWIQRTMQVRLRAYYARLRRLLQHHHHCHYSAFMYINGLAFDWVYEENYSWKTRKCSKDSLKCEGFLRERFRERKRNYSYGFTELFLCFYHFIYGMRFKTFGTSVPVILSVIARETFQ